MNKKAKKGLPIFIICAALSVLCILLIADSIAKGRFPSLSANNQKRLACSVSNLAEKITPLKKDREYIAAVSLKGEISSDGGEYDHKWFIDTIKELKDDPDNIALVLYVDSPGGEIYLIDEAYLTALDYSKEKYTAASLGPIAASGGYYVACAADRIYANRNALTGSIGVRGARSVDATELLKKIGVTVTTFYAGKNKTMLDFNEPVTEEQADIMQSVMDEAYEQFVDIVSERRGLDIEYTKRLADGRLYTAAQAAENGLIDGIATLDETIELVKSRILESKDAEDVPVVYFDCEKKTSPIDFFFKAAPFKNGALAEVNQAILSLKKYHHPLPSYRAVGID